MGIMVAALGFLYGTIFKQDMHDYLPYLAAGFVVWGLISSLMTEGTTVFIGAEGLIRQLPAPLSVHVYRLVWRQMILFAHNIVIYLVVAIIFPKPWSWADLSVFPALMSAAPPRGDEALGIIETVTAAVCRPWT